MATIISGTNGIDKVASGVVDSTALAAGSVTQPKVGSNVAGTGPAFSANKDNAQTISTATLTKVSFQSKFFDTANCFDNSTNYRFTPNVAGYYQLTFCGQMDFIGANRGFVYLYKNGSSYIQIEQPNNSVASTYPAFNLSALVYLNGSTDYVEIYVQQNSGGNKTLYGYNAAPYATIFSGSLVRAA